MIVKKQKTKTTTKYLVKWLGYPDKFNSWIDEKDLKLVFMSLYLQVLMLQDRLQNLRLYSQHLLN